MALHDPCSQITSRSDREQFRLEASKPPSPASSPACDTPPPPPVVGAERLFTSPGGESPDDVQLVLSPDASTPQPARSAAAVLRSRREALLRAALVPLALSSDTPPRDSGAFQRSEGEPDKGSPVFHTPEASTRPAGEWAAFASAAAFAPSSAMRGFPQTPGAAAAARQRQATVQLTPPPPSAPPPEFSLRLAAAIAAPPAPQEASVAAELACPSPDNSSPSTIASRGHVSRGVRTAAHPAAAEWGRRAGIAAAQIDRLKAEVVQQTKEAERVAAVEAEALALREALRAAVAEAEALRVAYRAAEEVACAAVEAAISAAELATPERGQPADASHRHVSADVSPGRQAVLDRFFRLKAIESAQAARAAACTEELKQLERSGALQSRGHRSRPSCR